MQTLLYMLTPLLPLVLVCCTGAEKLACLHPFVIILALNALCQRHT